MDKSKQHLYQNDSVSRIFQLGGEGIEETEIPGVVNEEGESGGEEELEKYGITERHEIFARYHNSIVKHLGVERTLKVVTLGVILGLRQDVSNSIGEEYARRSSRLEQTGRTSGESSKFSIFTYFSICTYARSAEKKEFLRHSGCRKLFQIY